MKGYSSRELINILLADGWYYLETRGDHQYYKHPTKPGKLTVPHPKKDLPQKTIATIFDKAGLK